MSGRLFGAVDGISSKRARVPTLKSQKLVDYISTTFAPQTNFLLHTTKRYPLPLLCAAPSQSFNDFTNRQKVSLNNIPFIITLSCLELRLVLSLTSGELLQLFNSPICDRTISQPPQYASRSSANISSRQKRDKRNHAWRNLRVPG